MRLTIINGLLVPESDWILPDDIDIDTTGSDETIFLVTWLTERVLLESKLLSHIDVSKTSVPISLGKKRMRIMILYMMEQEKSQKK